MIDVAVEMLGNYKFIDISLFEVYLCCLRDIGMNIIIIIIINIDRVCFSFQHTYPIAIHGVHGLHCVYSVHGVHGRLHTLL